jgi:hypothetical protein
MTQRERSLLLIVTTVGGFVLLFGGFLIVSKAMGSLEEKDKQISSLENEIRGQEMRLMVLAKKQAAHERWRAISLPADHALATTRYRAFLQELTRTHALLLKGGGITDGSLMRTSSSRTGSTITPLAYSVQMEGTLSKLVAFLRDFYSLNLPHLIRDLTVTRVPGDTEGRLDIVMKIEALSLPNAANRDFLAAPPSTPLLAIDVLTQLKGGPAAFALAPWLLTPTGIHGSQKLAVMKHTGRDYGKLIAKNIFLGLTKPEEVNAQEAPSADKDTLKFVQLTSITANFLATEATLYNRLTGRFFTLRAEGGFDSFEIHDAKNLLVVKATVRAITDRDVIVRVDNKHYAVHIGSFLKDALEKELSVEELKKFGVSPTETQTAAEEKEKAGEP